MPRISTKTILPVLALVLLGLITVALWQDQVNDDREVLLRHAQTSAEQLRIRIEGLMGSRIASLKLIADRWVERHPPDFSEERFYSFAEILYRHHEGYAGVDWIDPDGVIQWVYPKEDRSLLKGRDLAHYADARCQEALIRARQTRKDTISLCALHELGGMGFHVIVPLMVDDQTQGFLEGFFLIPQIMTMSVPPGISEDFSIRLYEEGRLVYSSEAPRESNGEAGPITVRQNIQFAERNWQVMLEPRPNYVARIGSGHSDYLVFGFVLSASLAMCLFFLLRRMEMYRESRDEALREIAERQRVEAVLRVNEQKLEGLLAELAAKNAEMESFVYTVSHDLKTPIVTIEGFIGALREDFEDRLSEAGEQYLRYMSDAARKMEALINDLLNLSRIGRLAEAKEDFPFFELVQEAVETLRPQMEAWGIQLHVQEDMPTVYGERKRIAQVIDNLLSNAVKYIGRDNPNPRIDIGARNQGGQTVFFVRDNGIGIEARYFDKIFQIFERLPAAKRVGEGTGIGLTIVKRIIEYHGGRIWLTSEPGQGTTFFFTLGQKDT